MLEGDRLKSGQNELVEMAVAVANKNVELDDISGWLQTHAAPVAERD